MSCNLSKTDGKKKAQKKNFFLSHFVNRLKQKKTFVSLDPSGTTTPVSQLKKKINTTRGSL